MRPKKIFRGLFLLPALALLAGCNAVLLHPEGDVALQQRDLIIISLGLMLLIVIPVILLTLLFAWRYRARNKDATYDPEWHHSTMLELMIWAAPLLIIIALGALTWVSTHKLDPYRPLDQISKNRPVAANTKPLVVEVVALDWKWLFFYPEQGIATVNDLAAPVDRPIEFKITASSVMNSFFIPSLAGQIYAMPGMQTTLNAVINKTGDYEGFSANFSGDGFSGMRFTFHGMSNQDFDAWVQQAHKSSETLSTDTYQRLAQPSEREPIHRYSSVAPGLYEAIMRNCVASERTCNENMMGPASHGGEDAAGKHDDMHGMSMAQPGAPTNADAGHASMPTHASGDSTSAPAAAPTGNSP